MSIEEQFEILSTEWWSTMMSDDVKHSWLPYMKNVGKEFFDKEWYKLYEVSQTHFTSDNFIYLGAVFYTHGGNRVDCLYFDWYNNELFTKSGDIKDFTFYYRQHKLNRVLNEK